jgi:hypothetical protein
MGGVDEKFRCFGNRYDGILFLEKVDAGVQRNAKTESAL